MASLFKTLTSLSGLMLLALGGYLFFVSYQAPNFYIFGDLEAMALILFLVSGIMITIWMASQIAQKAETNLNSRTTRNKKRGKLEGF